MTEKLPAIDAVFLQLPQESVGIPPAAQSDFSGADALNEFLIEHTYRSMVVAKTADLQSYWYGRMARYVAQRSAQRIAQMEKAKGLA